MSPSHWIWHFFDARAKLWYKDRKIQFPKMHCVEDLEIALEKNIHKLSCISF